ncbi:hypothetical protein LG288_05915 [Idiomarina seosinensis]|uniref:hypothetical protein n=1 Tax=Idiomarina seosinensis TaxID=281739 RepID=UPI00384EEB78
MGGSSSRTVTETDQRTSNEYNTIGQEVGDGIGILGDGNSLTMTDHGAMDMGMDAFNAAVGLAERSQDATESGFREMVVSNEATTENALNFGRDSQNESYNFARDAMATADGANEDALNFGRDSLNAVERIAQESQVGAMDAAQMVKETSEYQSENAINAALTGAGMGLDIANDALISNENLSESAMQNSMDAARLVDDGARNAIDSNLAAAGMGLDTANNSMLAVENMASESGANVLDAARMSDATVNNALESGINAAITGAGMGLDVASGTMRDAMAAYESQAVMYGDNMAEMGNQVADLSAQSLQAQNELAGQSLNNYRDLSEMSMSYADSQNRYLAETLGENSLITQTSLLEMAEMQERSLDSALQVAGAVAMDDNAEIQESQVKYLAMAMAVGMAAFAFSGKRG